ncbi:RNA polymerase sigma factor [Phenylobacterium montanum]|uniref:Sigma-70 family RNA polymerase sigma factor n=1 Tax=Phenylobacterium montanum TaxID=2823693 RepID=A0A975IWJ2_9CAUL|nr:sigma-70 family RNA polymerase sigma factor [Caulobacter sp. S6]QUD90137.1 sigma-70 family RNA polymerase sigma factor [Caulobacter sp. S6]
MTMDVLAQIAGDPQERGGDAGRLGARLELDRLFRAETPRLTRFFARRVWRQEQVCDLLQETFLHFLRVQSQAGEVASPGAYLQRIASNLLRDFADHRALWSPVITSGAIDPDAFASSDASPLDHLEAQDLLRKYQRALGGLKPKTREIFLLHRRDGLTYGEIAIRTDMSVSGVEKHMMKAIAHIDRVFGRV